MSDYLTYTPLLCHVDMITNGVDIVFDAYINDNLVAAEMFQVRYIM